MNERKIKKDILKGPCVMCGLTTTKSKEIQPEMNVFFCSRECYGMYDGDIN